MINKMERLLTYWAKRTSYGRTSEKHDENYETTWVQGDIATATLDLYTRQ